MRALFLALCVAMPAAAYAVQDVPATDHPPIATDANGQVNMPESHDVVPMIVAAVAALQRKNFALVTSLAIMLLVFMVDMLWVRRQPDDKRKILLPWTSVIFACLLQFSAAIAANHHWLEALNMAFVTGAAASGLWSLIGKQVVGRLAPKDAAANPDRQTTAVPPPDASVVKPS
jgi:hypothetical protein